MVVYLQYKYLLTKLQLLYYYIIHSVFYIGTLFLSDDKMNSSLNT